MPTQNAPTLSDSAASAARWPYTERDLTVLGQTLHIREAGSGPLVVLCHGFPECGHSWKAQLAALAAAGYHAVAPDMRGYGGSFAPHAVDEYTLFHLVGDIMGLIDALGAPRAVLVGHDWGAPVAWWCGMLRPERVRGVLGLSVPFFPRPAVAPSLAMPQTDDAVFYQTYFCDEGRAEAELQADLRATLRKIAVLWSGDSPVTDGQRLTMVPRSGGLLTQHALPDVLPPWVTEADLAVYHHAFTQSGFRGPLNWYRNIDRNWSLTAPWHGAPYPVPARYLVGERDLVLQFRSMDRVLKHMPQWMPQLRGQTVLPGIGHWIQREATTEVNQALLEFIAGLPA